MGDSRRTVNTSVGKPIYCGPCIPGFKWPKKIIKPRTPSPELVMMKPPFPERFPPPRCPKYTHVCKNKNPAPEDATYQTQKGPLISSKKEILPGDAEDVRVNESLAEQGEEVKMQQVVNSEEDKLPEVINNEEVKESEFFYNWIYSDSDSESDSEVKEPDVVYNAEVKEPEFANSEEVKEPEVVNNEEVKKPEVVNNEEERELEVFINEDVKEPEVFNNEEMKEPEEVANTQDAKESEQMTNNEEANWSEDAQGYQVVYDIMQSVQKDATTIRPTTTSTSVRFISSEKEEKYEHTPTFLATTTTGSKSNENAISTPFTTAQVEYLEEYQFEEKLTKLQDFVKADLKPEIVVDDVDLLAIDVKEFIGEVTNEVEEFVGGVLSDVQRFKEGLRLDVDRFFNSVEKKRFERQRRFEPTPVSLPNPMLELEEHIIMSNETGGVLSGFCRFLKIFVPGTFSGNSPCV